MRALPLTLIVLLAACAPAGPGPLPESDAHATMDPDRDLHVDGVQVTDLVGAEDGEALSPDGAWIAFVGGATGIASVYAVALPGDDGVRAEPVQLTNVGLEHVARTPGKAPLGFVPPPDRGPVRWLDDRTVAWTAAGLEYTASVPR
ncbi:MAG: hypothetical protein GY898_21770 [Proteobacteria bacterium]|nr:hypothetical protein [Pseudomonadota bacterium]